MPIQVALRIFIPRAFIRDVVAVHEVTRAIITKTASDRDQKVQSCAKLCQIRNPTKSVTKLEIAIDLRKFRRARRDSNPQPSDP